MDINASRGFSICDILPPDFRLDEDGIATSECRACITTSRFNQVPEFRKLEVIGSLIETTVGLMIDQEAHGSRSANVGSILRGLSNLAPGLMQCLFRLLIPKEG